jgi:hypothetical protein
MPLHLACRVGAQADRSLARTPGLDFATFDWSNRFRGRNFNAAQADEAMTAQTQRAGRDHQKLQSIPLSR